MTELKLASMNCRGLGDLKKRRDVMQYMRNTQFDVLFLQDTHLTNESIPYFNSLWKGKSYHSCYSNRSRGVSILFRHCVQHEIITVKQSDCGNLLIVACKIGTQTFLMVNIYGPNEDNPDFFHELSNQLDQIQTDQTIIAGDLNFVMDPTVDSYNYAREYNVNAKRVFVEYINGNGFIDAWRRLNPEGENFTWKKSNPVKCGRLDMFFVSPHLINLISNVAIIPGYRTDHSMVTLTVTLAEIKRGPGLWKLNESVLRDSEYIDLINTCIKNTVYDYAIPVYTKEYATNPNNYASVVFQISDSLFYETLLMLIRGETVQYCKRKARSSREKEKEIQDKIDAASQAFVENKTDENFRFLSNAQEELEEHRKPYIEGLIVRSRTQYHEEGEKHALFLILRET